MDQEQRERLIDQQERAEGKAGLEKLGCYTAAISEEPAS